MTEDLNHTTGSHTSQVLAEMRAQTRRAFSLPAETLQDSLLEQIQAQNRRLAELEDRLDHLAAAALRAAARIDEWAYLRPTIDATAHLMFSEAIALRMAVQPKAEQPKAEEARS